MKSSGYSDKLTSQRWPGQTNDLHEAEPCQIKSKIKQTK